MEVIENQTIGNRIKSYLKYKNISIRDFERAIDASDGYLINTIKGKRSIGSDKIELILNIYQDLNIDWLLLNKGEMLKTEYKPNFESLISEPETPYIINKKNTDNNYEEIIAQLKKELAEKEYIIQLQKQLLELKK